MSHPVRSLRNNEQMSSRLSNLFADVAGRPSQSSYMWSGYRSPVTQFTVWLASVLRFVSPLQWIKYWYRRERFIFRPRNRNRSSSTRSAGSNARIDVPPAVTDIYFISVSVFILLAILLRFMGIDSWVLLGFQFLAVVFLIESITWIFYYFLLVRIGHVEEDFVIWSPAEYILLFPLQIWIQGGAIALVSGTAVLGAALTLVGQGTPVNSLEYLAAFLSVIYLGILIAALLGSLRPMRSRKTQFWYVLGAGDAVRRLILPALNFIGVQKRQRVILNPDPVKELVNEGEEVITISDNNTSDYMPVSDFINRSQGIYVIASPTETHVRYLRLLKAFGRRGVCEKPFTLDQRELQFLEGNSDIFQDIFCLSYYSLDKGLPLTYLFDPRVVYEPYLSVNSLRRLNPAEVLAEIGHVVSMNFTFIEPVSVPFSRDSSVTLRDLEDLLIHPFTVVAQVLGVKSELSPEIECTYSPEGRIQIISGIEREFSKPNVTVNINVYREPNGSIRNRVLECLCTRGSISINFDDRSCKVFDSNENLLWHAKVADAYSVNYSAMFSMVHTWVHKENDPRVYDLLGEQLWANSAWLKIKQMFFSLSD